MGLLAHWTLDDLKDSYGDNDLMLIGNGISPVPAKLNGGYVRQSYADSTGYLISEKDFILNGAFSLSCWAKITDAGTSANGVVTNHSHTTNSGAGITVRRISDTDYRISCNTGNGSGRTYNSYYGSTNIKDKWVHLAVTYNREKQRIGLWVNGKLDRSYISYDMYCPPNPIAIHLWSLSYLSTAYRTGCIIDDVKVHDHELSEREMWGMAMGELVSIDGKIDVINNSDQKVEISTNRELPIINFGGVDGIGLDGSVDRIEVVSDNLRVNKFSFSMHFRIDEAQDWYSPFTLLTGSIDNGEGRLVIYRLSHTTIRLQYVITNTLNIDIPLSPDQMLQWNHIGVSFSESSGKLSCYVNGELIETRISNFAASAINTSVFLGSDRGISNFTNCSIHSFKWFTEELLEDDFKRLSKTKASLDTVGNLFVNSIFEHHYKPTPMDWSVWEDGQSGAVGMFNVNGSASENHRVLGLDPFGREIVLWEARPDNVSGSDGGYNSINFPIDHTKMYRMSVWIKRKLQSGGNTYMGTLGRGSSVRNRSNGVANGNPYFMYQSTRMPFGEWCLFVGHIFPSSAGMGSKHEESGIYTVEGKVMDEATDFYFDTGTTSIRQRSYLYYCTDTNQRQWWCYPRIDLVDGTEPSINQLLGGYDSLAYDVIVANGMSQISKLSMGVNNSTTRSINETKVLDGVELYYPLDGMKEMVGRRDSINDGAVLTSDGFLVGNGAVINLPNIDFSTETKWTVHITYKRIDEDSNPSWRTILGSTNNRHPLITHATSRELGIFDGSFRGFGFIPNEGETYSICVRYYSGTSAELFVNGVLVGYVATTLDLSVQPITTLGNWYSKSYGCGIIRNFQIYQGHLTDKSIHTLSDLELGNKLKINETTYIGGSLIEKV